MEIVLRTLLQKKLLQSVQKREHKSQNFEIVFREIFHSTWHQHFDTTSNLWNRTYWNFLALRDIIIMIIWGTQSQKFLWFREFSESLVWFREFSRSAWYRDYDNFEAPDPNIFSLHVIEIVIIIMIILRHPIPKIPLISWI